jgi:Spy/CpxP family protein refolding chaperone
MFKQISFYISISLIGLVGFIPIMSQAEDFKPSSAVTALMPVVMDNLDTLQISQEQLDKLRVVSRGSFSKIEFINAQYHQLKTQLKEETLEVGSDIQKSRHLIDELVKLDKQRMSLTIECVFSLKEILTQEQYKEVVATLKFNE